MKALLICGSPRAGGNTETLLKRCAETLERESIETEIVLLREKTVKGCTACNACQRRKDGTCAIRDDDFHEIFEKMREADILVPASPVYYGSATPELMALLDRAGYVSKWSGGFFRRKVGGPFTVAARAGQNFTLAQLTFWFLINDCIVPGSSYWNMAIAQGPGAVMEDTPGIETMDRFAENLAWLAKKLQD